MDQERVTIVIYSNSFMKFVSQDLKYSENLVLQIDEDDDFILYYISSHSDKFTCAGKPENYFSKIHAILVSDTKR